MSTERGLMIQETVRAMGEERYLRQLAEQRDRRMAQKKRKQKKEADTAGVLSQHAGDVLVTEVCEMREHFTVKEKPVEGFDLGITVTTSSDVNVKNTLNNYTKESEECQYVKSDTPGNTSGREIRQQGCSELPVHLL